MNRKAAEIVGSLLTTRGGAQQKTDAVNTEENDHCPRQMIV